MGGNLDVPGGGRRLQVSVQGPRRTSAAQVQTQPLGISSQHLGAFNPKHRALLSNCGGHTVTRAAWICSLLLHSLCKGCSLHLQCCARPSSPVQPTHTSLPKRPASAPPGLEAPKSRNQGSALQPQGPRGLSTESGGSVGGAELLTQRGAPGSGRRAWPRQWRHSGKWEAMSLRV